MGLLLCATVFVPVLSGIIYLRHSNRRPPGDRVPLWLYITVLVILGVVSAWAGVVFGIEYACKQPAPGNLCGLWGFFITGPLSFILTVTVVSWLMTHD